MTNPSGPQTQAVSVQNGVSESQCCEAINGSDNDGLHGAQASSGGGFMVVDRHEVILNAKSGTHLPISVSWQLAGNPALGDWIGLYLAGEDCGSKRHKDTVFHKN